MGWLFLLGVVTTGVLQAVLHGWAILSDRRAQPIFPRWVGYWVVTLVWALLRTRSHTTIVRLATRFPPLRPWRRERDPSGGVLHQPWVAAIAVQLRRIEGPQPPLTYVQLGLGTLLVLLAC